MRSRLIIVSSFVFFVFALTANAFGQEWSWMNPLPQGNTLTGVWGSSATDVYAVGARGTIFHYDGSAWSPVPNTLQVDLSGIWGSSADDVFAVTYNAQISHYDGTSWQPMYYHAANDAWGASAADVFAVASGGSILHYNGESWSLMTSGTTNWLYGVWGSSAADVFAVGAGGTILHYDGSAWSAMASGTTCNLSEIWGSSATDMFAVGASGTILHWDGSAWSAMASGTTCNLSEIWGSSADDVFAVGENGTILHWDGSAWSAMASGTSLGLLGVWGSSGTDVHAAGENGIILHYDGSVWSAVSSGPTNNLFAVWGSSAVDVFAAGASGIAMHYNGSAWSQVILGDQDYLYDLWGSSGADVFAVGYGYHDAWEGVIYHYNGTAWSAMASGTANGLYGVWGSSATDVFAVGNNGTILRYDGSAWSAMASGTSALLSSVWGGSAADVFAVGASGTILHWDGSAWSAMASGTSQTLKHVWGTSPANVYAVGNNGTILHWDGSAWEYLSGGTGGGLNGIWGSGADDIFAVASDYGAGTVLHSGGGTWSELPGLFGGLNDVWGSSATDVFVVGADGAIRHFTGPDDDDYGNSCATAFPVELNSTVNGSINFGYDPDADYFVFQITEPGFLNVQATSDASVQVNLIDGTCSPVYSFTPGTNRGLAAGTYYVSVESGGLCTDSYPYSLDIEFTPAGDLGNWFIRTVAGTGEYGGSGDLGDNGPATEAELDYPSGVAVDGAGNLYIADWGNHRIRMVDGSGIITTVAGNGEMDYAGDNGPATEAALNYPVGIAVDGAGNLYVADSYNGRIRMVDGSGIISTVAGNGDFGYSGDNGPATAAALNYPCAVAVDGAGNLYIADLDNHRIRMVDGSGIISTVAGNGDFGYSGDNGPATAAALNYPAGIAVDGAGALYIADSDNHRIRMVDGAGIITTVAGNGEYGYSGDNGPATAAALANPAAVAVDAAGTLYIADAEEYRIRRVDSSGIVVTLAGNGRYYFYAGDGGPAIAALLQFPRGMAIDASGNLVFADAGNYAIREIYYAGGTGSDADGDGVADAADNCPAAGNPQQLDADSDGIGDVCDPEPGCGGCGQGACEAQPDADGDGVADAADNCPAAGNPQQLDADSDGIGDVCDPEPGCGGCGQGACEAACMP